MKTEIATLTTKKQLVPEDLTDKKAALELKITVLQVQVSSGQLDQDKYVGQLKEKIAFEKELATKLSKQGKKDLATLALRRVKVMEKEVEQIFEQ